MIHEVTVDQISNAGASKEAMLQRVQTTKTAVARMQVDKEPFSDLRIRQAITASLDHEQILKIALRGNGQIAENHHVSPIHPEYFELPRLKRDIDKANRFSITQA